MDKQIYIAWLTNLFRCKPDPTPYAWRPFRGAMKTAWRDRGRLMTFIIANIFVGLLGALVPLLIPIFDDNQTFLHGFITALRSGSLYTLTIAILASTVILILQADRHSTTRKEVEDTRRIAVIMTFSMVVVLGILTGMLAFIESSAAPEQILTMKLRDWVQCILCAIGICLAIFVFLLAVYEEGHKSFAEEEDETVAKLASGKRIPKSDDRGMDMSGVTS